MLVYQLDRFARNRFDSVINKNELRKNGVCVISAKENISDDPSGILVEGILESMAEYYSAELSQKIRRGMNINAEKCLSNGSNPGLGYTVDKDRQFHIDPAGAAIVREIFEQYASGKTVAEIIRDLNARHVKTSLGKEFNKNSLHRLLRNRRYIGYYIYKGEETPNGMPRILDDELFERVQRILDKNRKAPARARVKEEYLLTTKLFCGYCREMMTGYSGTGKSSRVYHYYICNKAKKRQCKKKIVNKQAIEDRIVSECRKLLNKTNIDRIAKSIADICAAESENNAIKQMNKAIKEIDTAIENLLVALEHGQSVDTISGRIEQRKLEKANLEEQIAIENAKQFILTEPQIKSFLNSLKTGDIDNEKIRKGLVNIFLKAVYLYDDKFTLILNGSERMITIDDDILLDNIEAHFESENKARDMCSSLIADAPPRRRGLRITRGDFSFILVEKSPLTHSIAPPLQNESRLLILFACKRANNG